MVIQLTRTTAHIPLIDGDCKQLIIALIVQLVVSFFQQFSVAIYAVDDRFECQFARHCLVTLSVQNVRETVTANGVIRYVIRRHDLEKQATESKRRNNFQSKWNKIL